MDAEYLEALAKREARVRKQLESEAKKRRAADQARARKILLAKRSELVRPKPNIDEMGPL